MAYIGKRRRKSPSRAEKRTILSFRGVERQQFMDGRARRGGAGGWPVPGVDRQRGTRHGWMQQPKRGHHFGILRGRWF